MNTNSQFTGFYKKSIAERLELVTQFSSLTDEECLTIKNCGSLSPELCASFVENVIGSFPLPLAIATHFLINGKDRLIPMVVEESSVVAAASFGAKLARAGGGFLTESTPSIMTGQIQLRTTDTERVAEFIKTHQNELIEKAATPIARLIERGGGVRAIAPRIIPEISSVVVHVDIDTCDAMGANIVNTVCEHLAPILSELCSCTAELKILTNLTEKRIARAHCTIPHKVFADLYGPAAHDIICGIENAYLFAKHDIYRATTHNKGVMNGIDPVVIATGNDWRAVEAGAHAFCARDGAYKPMTAWSRTPCGDLHGKIELPMALGTVGGVTKLHPTARLALKILGHPTARELAEIVCAVGLAQNLSALRALATEGIQKGHMRLHQKNLDLLKDKG